MLSKLSQWFEPKKRLSDLEEYIMSKNPQTCEDVEYWTRMYDLRPKFVTHYLMPCGGMINSCASPCNER